MRARWRRAGLRRRRGRRSSPQPAAARAGRRCARACLGALRAWAWRTTATSAQPPRCLRCLAAAAWAVFPLRGPGLLLAEARPQLSLQPMRRARGRQGQAAEGRPPSPLRSGARLGLLALAAAAAALAAPPLPPPSLLLPPFSPPPLPLAAAPPCSFQGPRCARWARRLRPQCCPTCASASRSGGSLAAARLCLRSRASSFSLHSSSPLPRRRRQCCLVARAGQRLAALVALEAAVRPPAALRCRRWSPQ